MDESGFHCVSHHGLAIYERGTGPPLVLMPNPQGMVRGPEVSGPLADLLVALGRRVVTFDPPGAFGSTRPARFGLAEMLACTHEAIAVAQLSPLVDLVGHSQATLCQLAFAMSSPRAVRRLVLIGAVAGGAPATRKARGMPWCWSIADRRFWRFATLAGPLSVGRSNLRRLKRLQQLFTVESFVDPSLAPPIAVESGDERRPPPLRSRWQYSIRHIDLRPRLAEVTAPTLVCVGRHDPQTPWRSNAEIAATLRHGRLEILERSGHYPHIEEPQRIRCVIAAFLKESNP
jgi:pimeloyl-ACP methyl ester carboxylesterase